ncbi:unnamed protein product [Ilex paraguariensis]|uniref:Myosin motor domain-containing protein n=1 Tax=Ilex paraguariensis TaxID=185542 RepID=A0ABC8SJB6_9AQUA
MVATGCFGHSLGFRSLAWVRDPDVAWVDCEVVEANGEDIKDLVLNKYADVDDSSTLTYTGNIILTVKPFRKLPHLYDSHMMTQYKGAAFGELSPLPFSVADAAYSGESGAVTTESTKLLMWYLAYIVEQQVPESNPVLEAFVNANSVKNNNSRLFWSQLGIGSLAWVRDPDVAWVDCEVVEANGEEIKVLCFQTYTGTIILAMKPFIKLPHLYDSHMMTQYKGAAFGELSPLPFAVADAAYSQSILVSGESGVVTTESTKLLMWYVAYIVKQQEPESNPVLEASGKVKTVRNNNSRWEDFAFTV